MDGPEILTFVDGKYTDEIRTLIMDILALNVSMTKVDEVIKSAIGHLSSNKVNRFQSLTKSTSGRGHVKKQRSNKIESKLSSI